MRFDTRLAGHRGNGSTSHVRPIDLSTTYRTPEPEAATTSIADFAAGAASAANPIYSRLYNPNCRDFELRMTDLEGGADSVSFASGMAAVTALLLDASTRGGHVVAVPPLYGGTFKLLESGLLGTRVTWASPETVRDAIRPDTQLVLVETPSNPLLTVTDIERLVEDAGGVPVAVDSTFATPVLQNPLRHGASFALHSATKFIGGHGDAMGGVITTSTDDAAARLRQIRIATGAVLHPTAAHTFARGLQSLGLRVRAQQDNARRLVEQLRAHPDVINVRYPGADGSDLATVEKQMAGTGSVLSFELASGGPERADDFLSALRIAVPAVSLGSIDTLVQRPAALTHRIMGEAARDAVGIPASLIRMSVGAEDVRDLWDDIAQAIEVSGASASLVDQGRSTDGWSLNRTGDALVRGHGGAP